MSKSTMSCALHVVCHNMYYCCVYIVLLLYTDCSFTEYVNKHHVLRITAVCITAVCITAVYYCCVYYCCVYYCCVYYCCVYYCCVYYCCVYYCCVLLLCITAVCITAVCITAVYYCCVYYCCVYYTDCSFTEYVNKHHVEVASDKSRGTAEQKETENIDSFSDEQGLFVFHSKCVHSHELYMI